MNKINAAIVTQGVNEANMRNSKKRANMKDLKIRYDGLCPHLASYADFKNPCLNPDMTKQAFVPGRVYHAHDTSVPILFIKENCRTRQRAKIMLSACSSCGMTTPAILVMLLLVVGTIATLVSSAARSPIHLSRFIVAVDAHGLKSAYWEKSLINFYSKGRIINSGACLFGQPPHSK